MILPPSILQIRVVENGHRKVNLWLPLAIIWPLALALMVALSPAVLVLCIVWPKGRGYALAGPRILRASWAARGLRVRVRNGLDGVTISIW